MSKTRLALLCFLAIIGTVSGKCARGSCEKFECFNDLIGNRGIDNHLRTGTTFTSPCSCYADWHHVFCNETMNHVGTSSNFAPHPTVCICRKFSDNNGKCHQFMTRCYQRRNNECSCCINQPREHCNQLKCRRNEPDFGESNTSCICYHNSSDYPLEVCKNYYQRNSYIEKQAMMEEAKANYAAEGQYTQLFGAQISVNTISYVIGGLLLIVALLTLLMLVMGGNKLRRHHGERTRRSRLARESLILQRTVDDRYVPSS